MTSANLIAAANLICWFAALAFMMLKHKLLQQYKMIKQKQKELDEQTEFFEKQIECYLEEIEVLEDEKRLLQKHLDMIKSNIKIMEKVDRAIVEGRNTVRNEKFKQNLNSNRLGVSKGKEDQFDQPIIVMDKKEVRGLRWGNPAHTAYQGDLHSPKTEPIKNEEDKTSQVFPNGTKRLREERTTSSNDDAKLPELAPELAERVPNDWGRGSAADKSIPEIIPDWLRGTGHKIDDSDFKWLEKNPGCSRFEWLNRNEPQMLSSSIPVSEPQACYPNATSNKGRCWLCASDEHYAKECTAYTGDSRSIVGCKRCESDTPKWLFREELIGISPSTNPKPTFNHAAHTAKGEIPKRERCWRECYICGDNYHLARDCTKGTKQLYPVRVCWKCGRKTHLSKECNKFMARTVEEKWTGFRLDMGDANRHKAANTFLNLMDKIKGAYHRGQRGWEIHAQEQMYHWLIMTEKSRIATQLWMGAAQWLTEILPTSQFFELKPANLTNNVPSPSAIESNPPAQSIENLHLAPLIDIPASDDLARSYKKDTARNIECLKCMESNLYQAHCNSPMCNLFSSIPPQPKISCKCPKCSKSEEIPENEDDTEISETVARTMAATKAWIDRIKRHIDSVIWMMVAVCVLASIPRVTSSNVLDSYPMCAPSNWVLLDNPMTFAVPRTINLRARLDISKLTSIFEEINMATMRLQMQWENKPEAQNTGVSSKYRVQRMEFPTNMTHPTIYRTIEDAKTMKQIRNVCQTRGLQDYSPVGDYTCDAVNEYLLNATCGSQYEDHRKLYDKCKLGMATTRVTIWDCLHNSDNAAENARLQKIKSCGFWLNAQRRHSTVYDNQSKPIMDMKLTTRNGELLAKEKVMAYMANLDNYPQYVAYENYPIKLNWTVKCSGHKSMPDDVRRRREAEAQDTISPTLSNDEVEELSQTEDDGVTEDRTEPATTTTTTTPTAKERVVRTARPQHAGCEEEDVNRRVYCVDVRLMEELTEPARDAYFLVLHQAQAELNSLISYYQSIATSFKYLDTYNPDGQIEKQALQLRLHPVWHQLGDLLKSLDWTKTSRVIMPHIEQLNQIIKLVKTVRTQINDLGVKGATLNKLAIKALINQEGSNNHAIIYLGKQYYAQLQQRVQDQNDEYMAEVSFEVAFKGEMIERAELHPINMIGYITQERYILISRNKNWRMTFMEDPVDRDQCRSISTGSERYHICHIPEDRIRRGNTACADRLWQQREDGCQTIRSDRPTFFKDFCANQPNVLFSPTSTTILQTCKDKNGDESEIHTKVPRGRHHFNSTCRLEHGGQLIYSGGTIPQGDGSITITWDDRLEEAWRSKWMRSTIAGLSVLTAIVIWFGCCTQKFEAPRNCHSQAKRWIWNIIMACIPCAIAAHGLKTSDTIPTSEGHTEEVVAPLTRRGSHGSRSTRDHNDTDSSEDRESVHRLAMAFNALIGETRTVHGHDVRAKPRPRSSIMDEDEDSNSDGAGELLHKVFKDPRALVVDKRVAAAAAFKFKHKPCCPPHGVKFSSGSHTLPRMGMGPTAPPEEPQPPGSKRIPEPWQGRAEYLDGHHPSAGSLCDVFKE